MRLLLAGIVLCAGAIPGAAAEKSKKWEEVRVPGSPFAAEFPPDWEEQGGKRPVGYAERKKGWTLQVNRKWSRLIFYLTGRLESINLRYDKNEKLTGYRSVEDFLTYGLAGTPIRWEKDAKSSWRGHETRSGARLSAAEGGRSAKAARYFVIELGPKEFLSLVLHCEKSNYNKFLPLFERVKKSIGYAKKQGRKKRGKAAPKKGLF